MSVMVPSGAMSRSITIQAVSIAVLVADSRNSMSPATSKSASSGAVCQYKTDGGSDLRALGGRASPVPRHRYSREPSRGWAAREPSAPRPSSWYSAAGGHTSEVRHSSAPGSQ